MHLNFEQLDQMIRAIPEKNPKPKLFNDSQGIHIQIHTEELNFKLRINLFLIIYPIQYNIKYYQ